MDCPIYLDDSSIGTLRWTREGGEVRIYASCRYEEGFIYRLYVGDSLDAEKLSLGVMMPENGRFVLLKNIPEHKCAFMLSSSDVAAVIDRRRPGEERSTPPLPFAFSKLEKLPVASEDGDYVRAAFSRAGGYHALHMGIRYYVAPWEPGKELIPSSFFCLLTYFRFEQKGYIVLCVDKDNTLFPIGQRN